jgi:hypothetical protein
MAITTPSPGEILKEEEVKTTTGFVTGRSITPAQVAAAERARQNYVPLSRKIANTLENRQAKSFARLAEDTLIEADRKYKENPTVQNKAAFDVAYADFVKATNEYKNTTNATYETNRVKQELVGDLPAEPKGFDPLRDRTPGGAQTPGDRAKIDGAPDYIPPNTLDNNRWKNAFSPTGDLEWDSIYWNRDPSMVPISFFANDVGAIYQKEDAVGTPESLDAAVDRIAKQYADAGKMNELRTALISSGIASSQEEINALTRVQSLPDSNYMQLDGNTRSILKKGISLGSKINAALVDSGKKAQTFDQFLEGKYSSYFGKGNTSGGGSGTPRRTVNIQKQVFTPEELELSIDAFFQEYTGQGASQEDVDFLVKKFNKQSPQKTVNVRSGNTVTSTTTGGMSQAEQQLAMREMALQDPEAESYNKATTYLNYFREALASPIELG